MNANQNEAKVEERILVVDDDKPVLGLITKMLEISGYNVVARNDSLEALETFTQGPGQFTAVLTDLRMPYLSGDQLSERMMKIRPDIPIVLCTGYSDHISEERAREMGIKGYLTKPVLRRQIVDAVRQAIDENQVA